MPIVSAATARRWHRARQHVESGHALVAIEARAMEQASALGAVRVGVSVFAAQLEKLPYLVLLWGEL